MIEQLIPKKPFLDITALSFDEQLDFAIRQEHGIKPIVIPEGYNYLTPFLQHSWLKFTLNLSRYYRENQYFYKEMLQKTYPYLYSLNTKNNMGLPISAPGWRKDLIKNALLIKTLFFKFLPFYKNTTLSPNTNYIDFNKGLRDRNDLKSIVYGSLNDLKRRQIVDWLNLDDLWCQHQSNRANLADELISLASLEIFLKAEEIKKHL